MKNLLYLFVISCFFLFSCGGSTQSTDEAEETATEQVNEEESNIDPDVAKTCDEFLDNYEKWANDYLDIVAAYMKDPTNIEISQEYAEVAQSAATWSQEWVNYVACAQTEKYEKRWDEITDKLEKKMEELGLQD